jgi:hypothetical protein
VILGWNDRHAGYSYSGPAAAWAYAAIPTESMLVSPVFLLLSFLPILRLLFRAAIGSDHLYLLAPDTANVSSCSDLLITITSTRSLSRSITSMERPWETSLWISMVRLCYAFPPVVDFLLWIEFMHALRCTDTATPCCVLDNSHQRP